MIGEQLKRFMNEALGVRRPNRRFQNTFCECREAFNIVMAASMDMVGNPDSIVIIVCVK